MSNCLAERRRLKQGSGPGPGPMPKQGPKPRSAPEKRRIEEPGQRWGRKLGWLPGLSKRPVLSTGTDARADETADADADLRDCGRAPKSGRTERRPAQGGDRWDDRHGDLCVRYVLARTAIHTVVGAGGFAPAGRVDGGGSRRGHGQTATRRHLGCDRPADHLRAARLPAVGVTPAGDTPSSSGRTAERGGRCTGSRIADSLWFITGNRKLSIIKTGKGRI